MERLETKDANCQKCRKNFPEDTNAIGCEGNCKLWFHRECAGLSVTEFNALKTKKSNLLWMCGTCRALLEAYGINTCLPDAREMVENKKMCELLVGKLEQVETKTKELSKENQNSRDEIKEKLEGIETTLLQKMSLLLEAQLQQTEALISKRDQYSKKCHNSGMLAAKTNERTGRSEDEDAQETQITQTMEKQNFPENTNDANTPYENRKYIRDESRQTTIKASSHKNFASGPWKGGNRNHNIGTGGAPRGNLKAAPRIAWLFIGRLDENVTAEDLTQYVKDNGISRVMECMELHTRGPNKAFRIGVPFEEKDIAENAEFWPEGVIFRQYLFRR